MIQTIKAKTGTVEVAADEPGVVPGVIRVKFGPFPIYISPDEADQIAAAANRAALDARIAARRERGGT